MVIDDILNEIITLNDEGMQHSLNSKFDDAIKTHKKQIKKAESLVDGGKILNQDYISQGYIGIAFAKRRKSMPDEKGAMDSLNKALDFSSTDNYYVFAHVFEEKALLLKYRDSKDTTKNRRKAELIEGLNFINDSSEFYEKALSENKDNEVQNVDFVNKLSRTKSIISTFYIEFASIEDDADKKEDYKQKSIDYVRRAIDILEKNSITSGDTYVDNYHTLAAALTEYAKEDSSYEEALSAFKKVKDTTERDIVDVVIDFRLAKLEYIRDNSNIDPISAHFKKYLDRIEEYDSEGGVRQTLKKDTFEIANHLGGNILKRVNQMYE